jgi:hypothetical protein
VTEAKTALKNFPNNRMELNLRAQAHLADQPSKAANKSHDFDEGATPLDLLSATDRV